MAGDDKPAKSGDSTRPDAAVNREGAASHNRNRSHRTNRAISGSVVVKQPLFEGRVEELKGHIMLVPITNKLSCSPKQPRRFRDTLDGNSVQVAMMYIVPWTTWNSIQSTNQENQLQEQMNMTRLNGQGR